MTTPSAIVCPVDLNELAAPWKVRAGVFPLYAFLKALHIEENPQDTHVPGAAGELGSYQLKEITWRQHTTLPFTDENVWAFEDGVAIKHIRWLEKELLKRHVVVCPFRVALAWRVGLEESCSARWTLDHPTAGAYAIRVQILTNMETPVKHEP